MTPDDLRQRWDKGDKDEADFFLLAYPPPGPSPLEQRCIDLGLWAPVPKAGRVNRRAGRSFSKEVGLPRSVRF